MRIEKCSFCGKEHDWVRAIELRTPTMNQDRVLCDRTYQCTKYPHPLVLVPKAGEPESVGEILPRVIAELEKGAA